MRNHHGFLVGIARLGRAEVAAHNAQSGYRANAVRAERGHDMQKELGREPVTAVGEAATRCGDIGHV